MKTIIMICALAFVGGCIPPSPLPGESYSTITYYRDGRADLCFAHRFGGAVDCDVLREANITFKDI